MNSRQTELEDGRSPQAGRATLASHQAPAGLGHAEGIPNAWQPIETAPKDTPILAWCSGECRDDACGFHTGEGTSLCLYHAHAEGLIAFGDGLCIVEWGGAWDDSTWEYPNGGWMPDWWFRVGSEFEEAANPTHWLPLPRSPAQVDGNPKGGDAKQGGRDA